MGGVAGVDKCRGCAANWRERRAPAAGVAPAAASATQKYELLLLLLAAFDLGEHVAGAEDQHVFAVDRDLGAAVLGVHDGVAGRELHLDQLTAVLGATAGADGEDLTLLGLFLGGVGDDEAADSRLLGLGRPNDDPVFQRLQVHRYILLEGASRSTGLRGRASDGVSTRPRRVLT